MQSLEDCIDFMRILCSSDLNIPEYDLEKDDFVPTNCPEREGLLYIKTNNHDDFREIYAGILAEQIKRIKMGAIDYKTCEEVRENVEELRINIIEKRDKIYHDPVAYARALQELERRKAVNTEVLRGYGIDI